MRGEGQAWQPESPHSSGAAVLILNENPRPAEPARTHSSIILVNTQSGQLHQLFLSLGVH